MKEYSCGLLFNASKTRVVVIRKEHGPEHLLGKWNGVGGKIEDGESPEEAMSREFQEETSVVVVPTSWTNFLDLHESAKHAAWVVYFFYAVVDEVVFTSVHTTTDEQVSYTIVEDVVSATHLVPNLRWIIPMALSHLESGVKKYQVAEQK